MNTKSKTLTFANSVSRIAFTLSPESITMCVGGESAELGFGDLCKVLQVLRGECESVSCDCCSRKGEEIVDVVLLFEHLYSSPSGSVYRAAIASDLIVDYEFVNAEALGLTMALEGAARFLAFGI